MSSVGRRRAAAITAAVACHGAFALAIATMAWSLAHGLGAGAGRLHGAVAAVADLGLLLQFPVVHSLLLTTRGRAMLARIVGGQAGQRLVPTTYATVASLQLLATFWCWSPSGTVWHRPHGLLGGCQWVLFAAAWAWLARALYDAGLALQTGAAGWLAVWRDAPVRYGGMPERGLFRVCRQPIYLGFAAVLWTAPTWTPDLLLLASAWGLYCLFGPLHKEMRYRSLHGERFASYRLQVPYILPRFRR